MRIRTIKPEFWASESVGRLSRNARLLFIGLWSLCDDSGRCRGALPYISGHLFPYDADALGMIGGWLDELTAAGMVRLYDVDGTKYLDIPKWLKHQKIEKPSKRCLPPFPEHSPNTPRTLPDMSGLGPRILDLGPRTVDPGPACASEAQENPFGPSHQSSPRQPIAAPCDIPPRLMETWREIATTDGSDIAGKAMAAARRLFRGPTPAQLLETWKGAAASGALGLPAEDWPDFRERIKADQRHERNPSAIAPDADDVAFAAKWDAELRAAQ
jgi:hypothetical protein